MRITTFIYVSLATIFCSCNKLIDVGQPNTQLTSETVFSSDATATSALLAIYAQMEGDGLLYDLSVATGLSADEFDNYSTLTDRIDLYTNNLRPENTVTTGLWNRMYDFIYRANAVAEAIDRSAKISKPVGQQLKGEAIFLRAFFHFYLAQLYGNVPVIKTTDYRLNQVAEMKSYQNVLEHIEVDLKQADSLVATGYVNAINGASSERSRPNKAAVKTLLARVYLFQQKWADAVRVSSIVIESGQQYGLVENLNEVFLKNSKEAIWQLQCVAPLINTYAGAFFPFTRVPANVALSSHILQEFEPGDRRFTSWVRAIQVNGINYAYPYKYKIGQNASSISEYTMVLRLAELFLIRSEALAQQGMFDLATKDLNLIRSRAGLPAIQVSDVPGAIKLLELERKSELFAEAGDRWINLRRTMQSDNILKDIKSPNWSITDQLYPIPQVDIDRNPSLIQNPGY